MPLTPLVLRTVVHDNLYHYKVSHGGKMFLVVVFFFVAAHNETSLTFLNRPIFISFAFQRELGM